MTAPTKVRVTSRTWNVRFEDAPDVEVTTSSLRRETIQPVSGTVWAHERGVTVELTGPKRKADGSQSAYYGKGKVVVSGDDSGIPVRAPEWLADMAHGLTMEAAS